MSAPLPFKQLRGLVHIYDMRDKETVNGQRRFVYFVDNVTQEKAKWSTGNQDYIDVLDQLGVPLNGGEGKPGDFNVTWSGTKGAGELSIEEVSQ